MTSSFRVAVVIPAHDGLPDVLEAVDSALQQTLAPENVIVVEDGSTDGTGDAVRERFGDRVQIVAGRFGSAAASRNVGWRAATSPWIAFLDADDLWFPEKLATAAAILDRHPEAAWFFSDGVFRTIEGAQHDSWFRLYAMVADGYIGRPIAQLFEVNFVLTSSVIVRRDALERTQGFDESMSHAEDLDLWIRLARSWSAAASGRPLVRYQHRPGGLTRQVESRLSGDIALFRRLAADPTLSPELRRRARHREAIAHYKLAIRALRAGRGSEARRHLARAWMFPERSVAVSAAFGASLLPASWITRLRGQHWAMRPIGASLTRLRRVELDTAPDPRPADEPVRRP